MALISPTRVSRRERVPEIMDQPGLDATLHRRALAALQRINRVSGTPNRYWPHIERLSRRLGGRRLRLVDVACGGGDVAIALERRAARRRLDIEVRACDLSPVALGFGRERARSSGSAVEFVELDALDGPLPSCDVILCSLFLHHLDDNQAVRFLKRITGSARHLVMVSDLRRTRLGRVYAYLASRFLTRSPVVRNDAMLSVAAAFTVEEVTELARKARPEGLEITSQFPQRFLMTWRRS